MRWNTASPALFVLFVFVLVRGTAFGQSAANEQVLKLRTELVNVDVLAKQKETGRIISNLTKDDFTVFEDGVKQTVSFFSQERLPLSIVLLVDRAGCINAFNDQIRAAAVAAFGELKDED